MTKLEEMAAAMVLAADGIAWETMSPRARRFDVRVIRAIMAALRVPTEKMITVGNGESIGDGFVPDHELIERFQAMIDAALEE